MDQDKLDKLDELEVVEYSTAGGETEYVMVENTPYNRDKLIEIGATEEDLEDMDCGDSEVLDISVFAFCNCDAKYFYPGEGFR